MINNIIAV